MASTESANHLCPASLIHWYFRTGGKTDVAVQVSRVRYLTGPPGLAEPGAIIRDLRSLLTRLSLRLTVLVESSVEFASRCGLIAEIKVQAVYLFRY